MNEKSNQKTLGGDGVMTIQNDLDTTYGLTDDELTTRFKESIRIDNEIKKIKGLPIAGYDEEKRLPYIEYADGSRKYAE